MAPSHPMDDAATSVPATTATSETVQQAHTATDNFESVYSGGNTLAVRPKGSVLLPAWAKGQSGNPSGRPREEKALQRAARDLTRQKLPGVIAVLDRCERIIRESTDDMHALGAGRVYVDTWQVLVVRGFGKPRETVAVDPDEPEAAQGGGFDPAVQLQAIIAALSARKREQEVGPIATGEAAETPSVGTPETPAAERKP